MQSSGSIIYSSIVLSFHCLFAVATVSVALNLNENNPEVSWEYEPRAWTLDEDSGPNDDFDEHTDDTHTNICDGSSDNCGSVENVEHQQDSDHDHEDDPHRRQYFLRTISKQNEGQKCTQFKVDVREAVVCDKKRCDKFDFEWPKYDNQLTLIQTTKHGMRFHRVDYAFAETAMKKSSQNSANRNQNAVYNHDSKIKFDLLDLFKPKPSSTTIKPPNSQDSSHETTVKPTSPQTEQPETTTQTTASTTTTIPADRPNGENDTRPEDEKLITTFRLSTRRPKQTMIGFGGALSDSTCHNIKSLSPEMSKSLMEDYYGERGLRYNIARMSIGSSDFSLTPYTNNDKGDANYNPNVQKRDSTYGDDDVEMRNFHLVTEDYDYKLPVARQAIASSRQEIKFFSSLWSPPIWMKNNSNIVHGYLKGDVYGPYYRALAEYMVKWLDAYRRNGLEFWGMTVMNEPVTGVKPFIFHNSLGITRNDYVTFIKLYLGPVLKRYGFDKTKLIALDDNKGYAPNWARAVLEDREAAKYISGIAVHWYMNDEYENMNFLSKYFPDKFIISSEACNGYLPFQEHVLPGDWDRGVAYMFDMIKTIQKNAAAWVDWNMALNLYGGPTWVGNYLDAAVIVNPSRDEYYKSPMFYAMGHFSRFVERNSTRFDSRLANARYDYPVEAVGFKTPNNYIVIVALNANKYRIPFKIIVDRKLIRTVSLRADSFNTIIFKWKNSTRH